MAPRPPQGALHSLPPILRIVEPSPTTAYSKAPRGLFVLPRVGRIFTASSISPSPSLRQRSSRYAIRAGRNLPDKEFRLTLLLRLGGRVARSSLPHSACRHAVRTISLLDVSSVWRVVSEDSNQLGSGFPAVHRFGNLRDLDHSFTREMAPPCCAKPISPVGSGEASR